MTTKTSTALISGGTSGIGRAAANKLAQLGTMWWSWVAMRNAGRRQSMKFGPQEAKQTSFRPIS